MPDIVIPVTDEAYAMIEEHLGTIQKLSDDGKVWVPAGITVDQWVATIFRNACEPIISTSTRAAAVASREQMEASKRTAVDGLLFIEAPASPTRQG